MKKLLPAGAGETIQYTVHDLNDNTIRFVVEYPGPVDAILLRDAARALVFSVDVLHASFRPGFWRAHWQVQDNLPEAAYFTLLPQGSDPLQAAARPVKPGDPCPLRVSLIPGTPSAVVLCISHLVTDGSDGKYLLRKLMEAYRLLRETGSAASLQIKDGTRAYGQCYRHLPLRDRLLLCTIPMKKPTAPFPYPADDPGTPRLTALTLSAGTVSAARVRAKAANASLNDVLLAAMAHALADTADMTGPLSLMGMMDVRRHCPGGDSAGLCNMTGTLATYLPDGPLATFEATLASIAAQTRAAKADPHAGLSGVPLADTALRLLPMGLVIAVGKRIYGSMGLGLTNLGSIPGDDLRLDGMLPTGGTFGGPIKRKPGMQISAASFGGPCTLCVAGVYADADATLLRALLRRMEALITAYATAGCGISTPAR